MLTFAVIIKSEEGGEAGAILKMLRGMLPIIGNLGGEYNYFIPFSFFIFPRFYLPPLRLSLARLSDRASTVLLMQEKK